MDLIKTNTKIFCDRINSSSYEQNILSNQIDKYSSLIELYFSKFDHHYSMVESKDKELYIKQRILDIATDIDENISSYNSLNYTTSMKPNLVQNGLQTNSSVSSLLYLGDLYNIKPVVYLEKLQMCINVSDKNRNVWNILFTNDGKWMEIDEIKDTYELGEFSMLSECLRMDVTTKDIYKKFLNPIGKYKVGDIINMAKERNISLINNGKKKIKKELYDEINIYELNK